MQVVKGLHETSGQEFNGAHLRMEKDAKDWVDVVGGAETYWARYKATMRKAGFATEKPLPLYIASGLLKSGENDTWSKFEMQQLKKDMITQKVSAYIFFPAEKSFTVSPLAQKDNRFHCKLIRSFGPMRTLVRYDRALVRTKCFRLPVPNCCTSTKLCLYG